MCDYLPSDYKIHLLSAYPYSPTENFGPEWLLKHCREEDRALYEPNPAKADAILFVENHPARDPYFLKVLSHPTFKRYRQRCVLYHDDDHSVTFLKTISPSVSAQRFDSKTRRSAHYIARLCENETVNQYVDNNKLPHNLLFSFVGSKSTNKIRHDIFYLNHPRSELIDTSGTHAWTMSASEKLVYEKKFLSVTSQSAFVLCPRGIGPCSYRLFETMQLGRVPVIISDDWVPIPNVPWDEFSIRVPEARASDIPNILTNIENHAVDMGRRAGEVWIDCFSPQVSLRQLAIHAAYLLITPLQVRDFITDAPAFLQPFHIRGALRQLCRSLRFI